MRKVRYAVVGFGDVAEGHVAKEGFACDPRRLRPLRFAELVGATDVDPGRKGAATALGLNWYTRLDDVLDDRTIDAVYVATDNLGHAPVALACLQAGKHVVVESPFATTVADAKRMAKLAKAKGLSLAVDNARVYNGWNVAGRAAMAAGKLGTVGDCCFHMELPYGRDPAEAEAWRCARPEEMGGPVGSLASPCFAVAEFMAGKRIARLGAVYAPKATKTKVEDGIHVTFFFADGARGTATCAFGAPRGGPAGTLTSLGYEIYGDKGVMRGYGTLSRLSGFEGEPVVQRLEIDDGRRLIPVRPMRILNVYQALVETHAKSVLDGAPMAADAAVHNVALCAACHASAAKGGRLVAVKD